MCTFTLTLIDLSMYKNVLPALLFTAALSACSAPAEPEAAAEPAAEVPAETTAPAEEPVVTEETIEASLDSLEQAVENL